MRRRHRTEQELAHYQAGASDILVALFATPIVMYYPQLRDAILQLAVEIGLGVEVKVP